MCLSRQESLPTERSILVSFALCGLLVPAFQDTVCHSEDFFPSSLGFCRSLALCSSLPSCAQRLGPAQPFLSFALCCVSLNQFPYSHWRSRPGGPLDSGQREGEEAKARLRGLTQPLLFLLFSRFFFSSFSLSSYWLVGETDPSSWASHQSDRPQKSPRTSRRLPSTNDSPTNICRFSIRHPSNRPDPLISSLWPTPDPGFAPALKAQPSTSPFLSSARRLPAFWNCASDFLNTLDILLFPTTGTSHSLAFLSIEPPTPSKRRKIITSATWFALVLLPC